jgi:hypothetical protein
VAALTNLNPGIAIAPCVPVKYARILHDMPLALNALFYALCSVFLVGLLSFPALSISPLKAL